MAMYELHLHKDLEWYAGGIARLTSLLSCLLLPSEGVIISKAVISPEVEDEFSYVFTSASSVRDTFKYNLAGINPSTGCIIFLTR